MNWNDLLLRIRALAFHNHAERELDEELRFHLQMESEKHAAAGATDAESRRIARLEFGGVDRVKEECRSIRGTQLIETVAQDIRYTLRSFRRSPGFALTVIGTIALGLGLNTALFTLFNAYVLRPLSIRDPYSLYSFTWMSRAGRGHSFTWPEFQSLRKNNPVFAEVAASHFLYTRVDGHPMLGELVTGNYFQMLGVHAALGRTLFPADSLVPGQDPVMVLSYSAWTNKFGAAPDIVGKKIGLQGYPFEVIGVARQGFSGLGDTRRDYWTPLTMSSKLVAGPDLFGTQHPERLRIVGRLDRRLSPGQARSALLGWAKQETADRPDAERAVGIDFWSDATALRLTPEMIVLSSPLVVAFGLVLLLSCANVANMMLARALARQREIGIRLSLGAARWRVIRQLLTESILLAIPAGITGIVISQAAIQLSVRAMFATLPADWVELITVAPLPPDVRVFGFMLIAALISAVGFGLAPAIQATRDDVILAARGEFTSDVRPMRLRNALVIAQITICVILLICSGVLIRGADALKHLDIGFRTDRVVAIGLGEKPHTRVVARLAAEPVVQAVAAAGSIPLNGMLPSVSMSTGTEEKVLRAWYNHVSPEYFTVLDLPIVRGRGFTAEEANSRAPVAIISEATVRKLWPDGYTSGREIGQEIRIRRDARTAWGEQVPQYQSVRVIGVAPDMVSCCIPHGKDPALLYFPVTAEAPGNSLLIRVKGDAEAARHKLETELSTRVPGGVEEIHALNQYLAGQVYPYRAASWVSCSLAGLALLLTISGIYGVLSYLITQRTKEIGIRIALGAPAGAVARLVLRQSMRLAVAGICLGTAVSIGVSRLAAHVMFMNSFDLLAYSGGLILVTAASIAAAWFPTRRAARIDPITTLRCD